VLTLERVPTVGAAAVCGSANNVVASAEVAEGLHAAGITLVPDVLSSAGAVIEGVLTTQHGWGTAISDDACAAVERAIAAITPRVHEVLTEAAADAISPARVVARRLAARTGGHGVAREDTKRGLEVS
jgi:glutamate dehydrogenase/leucine dehydrogenase